MAAIQPTTYAQALNSKDAIGRPFKGVSKDFLSGYLAMTEFRRNPKRIFPEFIASLVITHKSYT